MSSYVHFVNKNQIVNCDITTDDIMRAEEIYGTASAILKGKMKRISPTAHPDFTKVPLPLMVSQRHKHLNMFIDIFYVNKIPFFLSKTKKIIFLTSTVLKSRSATIILDAIKKDCQTYERRGFEITDINGDNEFNIPSLKEALQPKVMHIYAKNEHVGFIENAIKTVKERTRCTSQDAPFNRYTKLMTRCWWREW